MRLGRIVGKVWATIKDEQLEGVKLYVLQPVNKKLEPVSYPIIAADAVGSGEGELVYWVGSREATVAFPNKNIPCDASIVGIVDSTYLEPQKNIRKMLSQKNILES
jgi:ethanolamine utilization protein EutN